MTSRGVRALAKRIARDLFTTCYGICGTRGRATRLVMEIGGVVEPRVGLCEAAVAGRIERALSGYELRPLSRGGKKGR